MPSVLPEDKGVDFICIHGRNYGHQTDFCQKAGVFWQSSYFFWQLLSGKIDTEHGNNSFMAQKILEEWEGCHE